MQQKSVIKNDKLEVLQYQDSNLYIRVLGEGSTLQDVQQFLLQHPGIVVTHYKQLGEATTKEVGSEPILFGRLREPISVEISPDCLEAYVLFYYPDFELNEKDRAALKKEVLEALHSSEVVLGIDLSVLDQEILCCKQRYLVAKGTPMQPGEDAVITMYEISKPHPTIEEDSHVNHYELNLIHKIEIGDWGGERKDPTPGIPGHTVHNTIIPAVSGKQILFQYDKKSFNEVYDTSKNTTYLYAAKSGALKYIGQKLIILDHLQIEEDISFKTGNINFDGNVTIKGTVKDNFTVVARDDIEILSEMGVGDAKEIRSDKGRIYIRGGVSGRKKTKIYANKDIYLKYANECNIECDGTVHIGLFCINCHIKAKQVILQSSNSKILGGEIIADIKVASSIIGSEMCVITNITINGFQREELQKEYQRILKQFDSCTQEIARLKNELVKYEGDNQLTPDQEAAYTFFLERLEKFSLALHQLQADKTAYTEFLKVRGEGAVDVTQRIYPNTHIRIKDISLKLDTEMRSTYFYYFKNEICKN